MRIYHFLRAHLCGYFWLPCPVCGKKFGGHEKGQGTLMQGPFGGKGTCPRCADSPRVKAAMESAMKQMQREGVMVRVAEMVA